MALREIIVVPDKRLRVVSAPVEVVTPEIRRLADDMLETMYDAPGIGLAAIQIAEPLRIVTMDLSGRDESDEEEGDSEGEGEGPQSSPNPRVFINPEIIATSEEL